MGFMNIYDCMDEVVLHKMDYWKYFKYNPIKVYLNSRSFKFRKENQILEREIMKCNHYFMGRTDWDKDIVKYYSDGGKYYHCEETIREEIYDSLEKWKFHERNEIRLVTIGNAGSLKGNEIMLKTAWLLKNEFHIDFEWIYTSDDNRMCFFENLVDIKCKDVNIKLIGRIDAKRIAAELCNAEFYVHTSIIDNSPNTLCEAQLIGTPVISTNAGGIPQLVENGESGFLYPYSEAYALAFRIMSLHNRRKLLEDVSLNEISKSHERHNPQIITDAVISIYKDIIETYNKIK
jgi:glycosyltransferase involved in cell wall biosynthesis